MLKDLFLVSDLLIMLTELDFTETLLQVALEGDIFYRDQGLGKGPLQDIKYEGIRQ